MVAVAVIVGIVVGIGIVWCFIALIDKINRRIKDDDDDE